jgi:hypothetical protein
MAKKMELLLLGKFFLLKIIFTLKENIKKEKEMDILIS